MHFSIFDIKWKAKQLTVNTETGSNVHLPMLANDTHGESLSQPESSDVMLYLESQHKFCTKGYLAENGQLQWKVYLPMEHRIRPYALCCIAIQYVWVIMLCSMISRIRATNLINNGACVCLSNTVIG